MKIKYLNHTYNITVDRLRCSLLQVLLIVIRVKRRAIVMFKPLIPVLLLIPVWALFLLLLQLFSSESFLYYLNEAKFEMFASVILVGATTVSKTINDRHKLLFKQHELYCNFMDSVERLIYELYGLNSNTKSFPNFPFYTESRCDRTIDLFDTNIIFNDESKHFLLGLIETANKNIYKIEESLKLKELDVKDDYDFEIRWCEKAISELKVSIQNKSIDYTIIEKTINRIYDLIEFVRYPWRRDEKIDDQIREIIIKNNPDPDDRCFYFNIMVDENYD